MRSKFIKSFLIKSGLAASVLLLGTGAAYGQSTVSLTAAPVTATLPDGTLVPMWGYTCGASVTASCTALNPTVQAANAAATLAATPLPPLWSPVVITVPYTGTSTSLTINLTNNLAFGAGNTVPTSLTIVGQLGGGLGTGFSTVASQAHGDLPVTWPTANTGQQFSPPPQGARVQSFGTEVAAGKTTALIWSNLRPGTYLIESGTHPSIQGPMGLYGMLVVTAPSAALTGTETAAGTAYPAVGTTPAVTYDAEVPILMSEIDPVQNTAVSVAVNTAGFKEMNVWSGQPNLCGNPTAPVGVINTCYPPAVNYTPLYYLMNGVAFNRGNATASVFPVTPATLAPTAGTGTTTGLVLVRLVNAGLRMHVPAIVGSQTVVPATEGAFTTASTGFSLVAEDGNPVPGLPRVQSEVFMAAGKTFDVMINGGCTVVAPATACVNAPLPVYDRELSLSGNANERDAGMLAYISVNGSALPAALGAALNAPLAKADSYSGVVAGLTLTVSSPTKGVLGNDINVYGAQVSTPPILGSLTLNTNGTFTYVAGAGWTATSTDSFVYCGNGTTPTSAVPVCATVSLSAAPKSETSGDVISLLPTGVTTGPTFTSTMATYLAVKQPGVLTGASDAAGLPLTVTAMTPVTAGLTIYADANGGFTAVSAGAGTYTFTYTVQNSLGAGTTSGTATVIFPSPSNLVVNVLDGYDHTTVITDYRWVIEEDATFYVNPACLTNPPTAASCVADAGIVPTLGVNFHTSHMPFVAQGCTGPLSCEGGQSIAGNKVVCDIGNGVCRPDSAGNGATVVMPGQVALDPTKRYYISVLPGDAATPFSAGYTGVPCGQTGAAANCTMGHGMGGAPVQFGQPSVTVLTQPAPYPVAKLSVFVFEDDFPLNGEQDGGGGVDVLSPNEPGLGGFQIHLWDAMGGNGDFTGQMTYDMFNQPLTNSLDGMLDPATGKNACPITQVGIANPGTNQGGPAGTSLATTAGITGMIVTCPKYESDGTTLSPLAGQAVVANLMPGRWGVIATPAADRIARGEEWLQTNTLDGQKAHDAFTRIGEPSYFQEFGPASFHVSIGFANPAIINSRHDAVCNGTDANVVAPSCNNTITGRVVGERLSRTPDERLYGSGSHDAFAWTQCYVSFGDPDGEDFAFTKCDADGKFTLTGLPSGDWRVTVFDQWNDQLVDGLSTPVGLGAGVNASCGPTSTATTCAMGDVASTQWETNLQTRTFVDYNSDGISQASDAGIPFANVAVRLRDGSLENLLVTDFTGTANFNETFPLFSWYVVETDVTRYKNTGTHVVYDVGGPADGSLDTCGGPTPGAGYPPCGNSAIAKYLANTAEQISVPAELRVPGAVYCATADCTGKSILNGPSTSDAPSVCTVTNGVTSCTGLSSGRIDPPWAGGVEGWQGFPGQFSFMEFGKEPYAPNENGGIRGHVIYASTRPFDDPQMLVQTQWVPLVPHVTINLYKEGVAADGVTPTLTLVDTTQTSSWDDFAQGFRKNASGAYMQDATGGGFIPNMNCPGQGAGTGPLADLFFYALEGQPEYLDFYNDKLHGGTTGPTPGAITALPYQSQFKCYDGMHNWNQVQPAPYDGMYSFPSVTAWDSATGKPAGTNCKICSPNQAAAANDLYYNLPMLPVGKYVVEVVVPPGFELVKEEDKNILIGDNYIAPVVQQFGGLGNVYIMPDQAAIGSTYNANNAQQMTTGLGALPENSIVPGFIPEPVWPCVGELRVVPDFISLFPQTSQVAPFAGASRHLCDRKEVTLGNQMHAIAKFYVFTSTHIASKFTGGITDDYTSEFDPFSPQFGEKFAPPQLPVSVKDWANNETNRIYADNWGAYDGMTYSTWEVNPPNPTGYSPTMMVLCMNDPGPIAGPNGTMVTDPLYTQGYSQFCYELPFMPGTTQYLDTPVVPTSAFAGAGYNNVDCAYPALTPAISEVDGDGAGPWVSAVGKPLTIYALGDTAVPNNAYSGPAATTAPFNTKTILRHYGFGATQGTVAIGGVAVPAANITGWGDTQITVLVPSNIPACAIQQQAQYAPGATTALCGQLVITTATGQQSVDAVTVTVGGKAPVHVGPTASIQAAIDQAAPGDLIIIDPAQAPKCLTSTGAAASCSTLGATISNSLAAHNEMVIMWKPVRLQGVGAASSLINANTHPAGRLDPWRREVNCLFGLALNGTPMSAGNAFDPAGTYQCAAGTSVFSSSPSTMAYFTPFDTVSQVNPQVDRLPLEATVGWDATLNGNLAQLLQEATLMGALEGAGITVLSKGVDFPSNPFTSDTFPNNTTLLTGPVTAAGGMSVGDANSLCHTSRKVATNPFPSNFMCNPSSIDGLSITDSSQGGGGIFIHGWGHNLQIANNRIANNAGTLSGGINVGQGEFPPAYLAGSANTTLNAAPGSCVTDNRNSDANLVLPYCQNIAVNVHNNNISLNSSTGDELFSGTPAGAGGISFCTGADFYKFNYNWICGNLSSGDGGGLGHLGFSVNADIEHNSFLFNQSLNPTIPANGGAMIIMGAPDVDPTCNTVNDADCVAAPGSVGPSDGVGRNMVINANLIMGNAAEAGTGGGISFQNANGSDVVSFPTDPDNWNNISLTNNIIVDNVAGWDGAGISLLDTLKINVVNNTIAANTTTATAGVLFNTLGGPVASQQGPTCTAACGTTSNPQPAGLVSLQNSAVLAANLPATVNCPANYYSTANGGTAVNGTCTKISYPLLLNNVIWQNSAYYVGVGPMSATYQQAVVTLYNAFTTLTPMSQSSTGQCGGVTATGSGPSSYWDIGVRGDTAPANHGSGYTLNPQYSILTDAGDYAAAAAHNSGSTPSFVKQYCDGSRQPPEYGLSGWAVPPGISDATVPNPIFNLTPVATVDEGNNWVNLRWGPLSMTNPVTNVILGNYALNADSAAIDYIPQGAGLAYNDAPATDFFGNARKVDGHVDAGAVEFLGVNPAPTISSITPTQGYRGTTVAVTINGTNLNGISAITFSGTGVTASGIVSNGTTATANVTIAATATLSTRSVTVTNSGGSATLNIGFTVLGPSISAIAPNTAQAGTSVSVTITGIDLTGATAVNAPGSPNITVTNFVAVNDTTVTATLTLAAATSLGGHNITVSTPNANGGVTNAVVFTVTSDAPTLTAISPATGVRGTSVPVTLTGTNLTGTTALTVSGTGVTCTGITSTATTVNATCAITATATLSARNVRVTTPGGTSNTVTFTVEAPLAIAPLTITLATGATTGNGTVTLTNNSASSSVTITNVTVTGGSATSYLFAPVAGADNCQTAGTIAAGGTCTVGVSFTNVGSKRGTNRTGTIHFTDSATGSPQSFTFTGYATP